MTEMIWLPDERRLSLSACWGILADDERQRARRLCAHRETYIRSRALLRCVLAARMGMRHDAVRFLYNEAGKPRAEGAPHFNVAHSGGGILMALADAELGIDLEAHAPRDVHGFARLYFSPAERAAADSLVAFYRIWTRKEAVMKACGMGIGLRPARFCALSDTVALTDGLYHVYTLDLAPGWSAALACMRPLDAAALNFGAAWQAAALPLLDAPASGCPGGVGQ